MTKTHKDKDKMSLHRHQPHLKMHQLSFYDHLDYIKDDIYDNHDDPDDDYDDWGLSENMNIKKRVCVSKEKSFLVMTLDRRQSLYYSFLRIGNMILLLMVKAPDIGLGPGDALASTNHLHLPNCNQMPHFSLKFIDLFKDNVTWGSN